MVKPANPRKTTTVRQLGPVEIGALRQAALAAPEEFWDMEDAVKPNRFETLGKTRHLVFRFITEVDDWRASADRPLWREWRHLLDPVLKQATAAYGYARGEFPRVMLARMAAGGVIAPHIDGGIAAKWPHKIHVPLVTNERVAFSVDGVTYHFPEGEAVEVNNMAAHSARNDGDTDRIHLIFEYFDPDQPMPDWFEHRQRMASA